MKYLVQIDGTNPKNWRTIQATGPQAAIYAAVKPLILDGHNHETAYIGLGEVRHENGAPICVQSYKLNVNRTASQSTHN